MSHLYIKAGDGSNRWPQFAPLVSPLREEGIWIAGWQYLYASDPEGEIAVAKAALATGCDGLVLDIEAECEGREEAVEKIWQGIREAYPDAWLAYSPLPVVDLHRPALYEVSNRYADAVLPQFYTRALGSYWGNLDFLFSLWERWLKKWEEEGLGRLPFFPVGQAFDDITPEEIKDFISRAGPTYSFWEWDHATIIQREAIQRGE